MSRAGVLDAWLGVGILGLTALAFRETPMLVRPTGANVPDGFHYLWAWLRMDEILVGVCLAGVCLEPAMSSSVRYVRQRWRDAYKYCTLAGICAFVCVFLVQMGRRQFGGWDFSGLIETGWRQIQGQRPYVDFLTTTPPGFNLGIKFAYELFGVNWDANLYFSAMFACLTLLWMYWLMRRLAMSGVTSLGVAFAIECAAMLTTCHWWFNDSAMILAAVFFLSCLAYAGEPRSGAVQGSYVVSLALLSLMKPNIAGAMIVGGVVLLFLATNQKMRLMLLTLGAAGAATVVLWINHVSIPAMVASYLSVAKNRASLGDDRFGYRHMNPVDRHAALCWVAVLSIPLLGLLPGLRKRIAVREERGLAIRLLFLLGLMIAGYGIATNSEYRDVECSVLLAAGGVLTFGLRWNRPMIRRVTIAILCASIAGDLYYGAARLRVYGIGPHTFFEWQDNRERIDSGFLKNMRVSSTMVEVEREVKLAKESNAGPYFFGPRVEFNYAVLGLPSPERSPAWWDPGTTFALSDQARMVQVWQEHRFETLIFLNAEYAYGKDADKMDYTYYSKDFLDAIRSGYVEDTRYPYITVWHRRVSEPAKEN